MSAANCVIFKNTYESLHATNIIQQLNYKGGFEVCNVAFISCFSAF